MIYNFGQRKEQLKKLPICINMVGVDHLQEPVFRPKGLSSWQWFYCKAGQGEVIIDQKRYVIRSGQGFLLYPGVNHAYQALSDDWTLHFIGFAGQNCNELLGTLGMDTSGVYRFTKPDVFEPFLQQLVQFSNHPKRGISRKLSLVGYEFLLTVSEHIEFLNVSDLYDGHEIVRKVLLYIEEHYTEDIGIDAIADHIGLSKGYVQTLFKKEMGRTIGQYICEMRIIKARVLMMQEQDLKAFEVAKRCGFESPSYFGKVFKSVMGMTPDQYKRSV